MSCVLQAIYIDSSIRTTDEGGEDVALLNSSFCQLFTYISTDRRKETMNQIQVTQTPNRNYEVQVAYLGTDSHDDKPTFEEPDVWSVELPASSAINAIITAMHIIQISRAETMTAFMPPQEFLEGRTKFTLDEIEEIRNHAEHSDIFKAWLDIQPTSIQVCLVEDREKLRDMTYNALNTNIKDVSKEAAEYLKEIDDDIT